MAAGRRGSLVVTPGNGGQAEGGGVAVTALAAVSPLTMINDTITADLAQG